MLSRIAVSTFVLAAMVSFADAQNAPTVTFTSRAAPVTRVLESYASATGKKVRAAPSMAGEIVVVRLVDADHEEFVKRLAAAVAGRWTTEGEERVLVADEEARAAEVRKELETRVQRIREAIKGRLDIRKREGEDEGGMSAGAGANLITAFLQASDPTSLARLKLGERVVFSTSPNAMQRPLPNAVWPHVARVVAEHNRIAAAYRPSDEAVGAKTDAELKMEAYLRKLGIDPEGERPRVITEPPAKLIAAVQRRPEVGAGLMIAVTLYDAKGKVLTQDSEGISFDSYTQGHELDNEDPEGAPEAAKADPNDPVIVLSEESRAVRDLPGQWSDEETAKEPSAEVLAKLRRPDLYDPLSFGDSEALLFVAEHKKKNLIAALPDQHLYFRDRATVSAFLASVPTTNGVEIADADGWLILRSATPDEARSMRISRPALTRLIAAQESKGYVGLDDMATYALATAGDASHDLAEPYLGYFVPGASFAGFEGPPDFDQLRLYGSLSAGQRLALKEGRQVPFAGLVGRARESLNALLFGTRVALDAPQAMPDESDPMAEMIVGMRSAFGGSNAKDYRSEPTEAMPRGLPADGYLVADVRAEPIGILGKDARTFGMPFAGGRELGMFLYFKSDLKYQAMVGEFPDPGPMGLGERTRWHVRVVVAPETEAVVRFSDSKPTAGGAKFTLQNLPPSLRAWADRTIAFMRANPLPFFDPDVFIGGGRGVPPPSS